MNLDNSAGVTTPAAADRLLGVIKRRGPQRIGDVAAALGVTAEAARQQVVRLAADGLLAPETERRGVGRPTQRWYLTEAGHARFPDTHAELTLRLIDAVRAELGEAALDRLIHVREQETLIAYRAALADAATLAEQLACLAEIRSREGYMAEWRADADGFLLLENHCPICAAATACQGFCRAELRCSAPCWAPCHGRTNRPHPCRRGAARIASPCFHPQIGVRHGVVRRAATR